MKAATWKKAVSPLIPADEEWRFRGRLTYKLPIRRILVGLLAENSAFHEDVYILRVTLPLFVPLGGVVALTYSERLGRGAGEIFSIANYDGLSDAVRIAMASMPDEDTELSRLCDLPVGTPNIRITEAATYARALRGDTPGAIAAGDLGISALQDALRSTGEQSDDWEIQALSRLSRVVSMLKRAEYAQVEAELKHHIAVNIKELGLETS